MKQKSKRLMEQQVERLLMVRNSSSYKKDIKKFIKDIMQKEAHHQICRETGQEIAQSFNRALNETCTNNAYEKRLLAEEIALIIKHKKAILAR